MSKKYNYECFIDGALFINTENDSEFDMDSACELLNQQDQRISELEEQLKNAIVPKFKVGQEVYAVSSDDIYVITIDSITIEKEETHTDFVYYDVYGNGYDWVYATKEEALAKLEELKGDEND